MAHEDDLGGGPTSGDADRGRAMAQTPGTLLVVTGVICLLFRIVGLVIIVSGMDLSLEMVKWAEQQQPAGKAKDDLQKQVKEMENRDRTVEYVQNGVLSAIGFVLDILILLGGLRMKATRGYKLAMTGAICGMIPCNGCCCIALPIGIWALVVLLKPEVKAAFSARSVRATPADDLDPGFER
jgi:hypothetical protein